MQESRDPQLCKRVLAELNDEPIKRKKERTNRIERGRKARTRFELGIGVYSVALSKSSSSLRPANCR